MELCDVGAALRPHSSATAENSGGAILTPCPGYNFLDCAWRTDCPNRDYQYAGAGKIGALTRRILAKGGVTQFTN
jgi:hypothetical protein